MKRKASRSFSGFVIPLVLLFLFAFSAFALAMTGVLIQTGRQSRNQISFSQAYYVARSGVLMGQQLLVASGTNWGSFSGSVGNIPFFVSKELSRLTGRATVSGISAESILEFDPSQLTGGSSGGSMGGSVALYASQQIAMSGNFLIEGNVGIDNGSAISAAGSVEIEGDLFYKTGTVPANMASIVTGDLLNQAVSPPTVMDFPSLPSGLPPRADIEVKNKQLLTLENPGKYTTIQVKNGGILNIDTGTSGSILRIEVDNVSVEGLLNVQGEGTLILTVRNNCLLSNGNITATNPSLFLLHFLNLNGTSFSLNSKGSFSGVFFLEKGTIALSGTFNMMGPILCKAAVSSVAISGTYDGLNLYAPQAHIAFSGNATLNGWVYGKTIALSGTGEIHYKDVSGGGGPQWGNPGSGTGNEQSELKLIWYL